MARRSMPVLLFVFGLTACGSDGGSGPSADTVASVSVTPSSATLTSIGQTSQLSAQAKNSSGSAVSGTSFTWASSNTSVATVSASGVVTAVADGTTSVRAAADGTTVSGSAQVTVAQAATAVVVTPEQASLDAGQTLQLSASATDAMGGAISNPTLAWSSSDDGIATVSSSGLVTGVANGLVTITATSGSASDGAEIDVDWPDLVIAADADLSGDIDADEFRIPAGVTVTATDDLTVRATGFVEIAGDIVGDCVALDIQGDTAVTVNGTIDNGCAAGQTPASLRIAADGELTLEDATVVSSGDMDFTNDPTLTDDDFPASGPAAVGPERAGSGVPFTRVNRSTVRYAGGETGPDPADPGADGTDGTNGEDGRTVRFRLRGNAIFAGGTTLWGQDGGRGGNGSESLASDVDVEGGDGGMGGTIKLFVTGSLTYEGGENIVRTGSGGKGGNATATALPNAVGDKAPSAAATAGDGGGPGLLNIRAGGGINVADAGALVIEVGKPGNGGDATATGADGRDALGATTPAQIGGDASATAGFGGDTPDKQLVKQGNVTGSPPVLRAAGGGRLDGGMGGVAKSTAGKGGNGIKTSKPGAKGGDIDADGGEGGDALTKGLTGAFVGNGGPGGLAHFLRGIGGNGWSDCRVDEPVEAGGVGGAGGDATGAEGTGGQQGLAPGANGGTRFENVANGGDGGDGQAPGGGGSKGNDGVTPAAARQNIGTVFTDGSPGNPCAPPQTITTSISVLQLPASGGVVPLGTHPVGLVNTADQQQIGTMPMTAEGVAGNHFVAPTPDRIGMNGGPTNSWLFELFGISVPGSSSVTPTVFSFCVVNSFGISALTPLVVEQLGAGDAVLETETITDASGSPPAAAGGIQATGGSACRELPVNPATRRVRFRSLAGVIFDLSLLVIVLLVLGLAPAP